MKWYMGMSSLTSSLVRPRSAARLNVAISPSSETNIHATNDFSSCVLQKVAVANDTSTKISTMEGNGIGHITFAMSNQDNFWARDDKFDSKIVMFRTQQ